MESVKYRFFLSTIGPWHTAQKHKGHFEPPNVAKGRFDFFASQYKCKQLFNYTTHPKMRKHILLMTAIFLGTMATSVAQKKKDEVLFEKKSLVATLGYGTLNLIKKLVFVQAFNFDNRKLTSLGPIVVGGEYGLTNNLGLGLQVGWGQVKGVYTQRGVLSGGGDYVETIRYQSLQFLARTNYHVNIASNLDTYIGAGLGILSDSYATKNNASTVGNTFVSGQKVSPISYTLAVGGRYYFSSRLGAYAEFGFVSGSLLQLGMVARF